MTIGAEPIRTEIRTQAFVIKIFYIKYNNLAIIYLFLMRLNNNIIYIRTVLHTCKYNSSLYNAKQIVSHGVRSIS